MNTDRLALALSPFFKLLSKSMATNAKAHFEVLPATKNRVVFLGDSITAGGFWDEWFPELAPINRGVGGNAIGDVLDRFETAIQSPKVVSLMIGTNDLSGLGRSREPEKIADQVRELVARIHTSSPATKLLINSVAPRSAYFAGRIRELNSFYQQIAIEAKAEYVDLWPAMSEPDGSIRKSLTTDGIHLTGEGYRVWVEVLRPYLMDATAEIE